MPKRKMRVMFVCRGAEYLGVESMSACLRAAGHDTDLVFDPGFDDTFYFRFQVARTLNRWDRLVGRMRTYRPDVLAVSSTSNTYPYLRDLVGQLKNAHDCFTVIGGVHASALPEYVLADGLFDAACIGEGEGALVDLVDRLSAGDPLMDIRNLCFRRDGAIVKNPVRPCIKDLDSLPFHDKSLFYRQGGFSSTLTMITGRGCCYDCNFCVNPFWKDIYRNNGTFLRRYSPARVIDEICFFVRQFNVKRVNFQDDIFVMSKEWLREFSSHYRASIRLPFQCNVHTHFVDDETVSLLCDAGCHSVCMGVQSADENKRKEILKRSETNDEIFRAVAILKKYSLRVDAEYIFGLPGETWEDIKRTISFNRALDPSYTATFMLYPFPGTEILENVRKDGLITEQAYEDVKKGAGSYHYISLLELPDRYMSYAAEVLLPVVTRLPVAAACFIIRFLSKKSLSGLVHSLCFITLPFNNLFQFIERAEDYFTMAFMRRKREKNG
ncbi:MAG TPA: cobalamin-dependent protein [Candidatus Omnitrophota bacterium]|nr:cobalamin-dependent protein [Candidatus Omnitrophota bacterium]HQQ06570.1 cobalamin-dependent protein [Candidatus Omnitrophota bacterium]